MKNTAISFGQIINLTISPSLQFIKPETIRNFSEPVNISNISIPEGLANATNIVRIGLRIVVSVAVRQVSVPSVSRIVRFRSGRPVIAIDASGFIPRHLIYLSKG